MNHELRRKALNRFATWTLEAFLLAFVAIPLLVVALGR